MPNEFAARYLSSPRYSGMRQRSRRLSGVSSQGGPPIHRGLIDIPGTEALPTFRGRTLYLPLYTRTFNVFGRRLPGLSGVGDVLGVVGSTIAAAASFVADIAKTVVSAVLSIITAIVDFIVDVVAKVVSAVVGAVSGLLGGVLDALGLKEDGDLGTDESSEMGGLLLAKLATLAGQENNLDRPMTAEEKAAYDRNLADSKAGISSLQAGANAVVAALGGPTGTIAIAGAVAAAIFLTKK